MAPVETSREDPCLRTPPRRHSFSQARVLRRSSSRSSSSSSTSWRVDEAPGTCHRHHRAPRVVFAGPRPTADRNLVPNSTLSRLCYWPHAESSSINSSQYLGGALSLCELYVRSVGLPDAHSAQCQGNTGGARPGRRSHFPGTLFSRGSGGEEPAQIAAAISPVL